MLLLQSGFRTRENDKKGRVGLVVFKHMPRDLTLCNRVGEQEFLTQQREPGQAPPLRPAPPPSCHEKKLPSLMTTGLSLWLGDKSVTCHAILE